MAKRKAFSFHRSIHFSIVFNIYVQWRIPPQGNTSLYPVAITDLNVPHNSPISIRKSENSVQLRGAPNQSVAMSIYSVVGKQLATAKGISDSQGNASISVGRFPAGVYFVKVVQGNSSRIAKLQF